MVAHNPHYAQHQWTHKPTTQRIIFATGIECSYPVIEVDGKRRRIDQLEKCRHYEHWKQDLHLVRDLGIRTLRYGPPYYRIHLGPDRYDWEFTDLVLAEMQRLGIMPIIDLCHFGVPDWIGDFQNPEFPEHFAKYAQAFARRYPWVWAYTPINEMYICAEFSGHYGWWNERQTSHRGFVTALKHMARAAVDAMHAIVKVNGGAIFVHAESSEHTQAPRPDLIDEAHFFNERRFLSMDLICGRLVSSGMYCYLMDNGMTEQEYRYLIKTRLTEHYIMGHDYYEANERILVSEHERQAAPNTHGYYMVACHYHKRYNLPVMHAETNAPGEGNEQWLSQIWQSVQHLRNDGVPLCGMTWYSLTHQMDWDTALREENNRVYPVGLYDLDRRITPVGLAYKDLIKTWHELPLLPNGPLTLVGNWLGPHDGNHGDEAQRGIRRTDP